MYLKFSLSIHPSVDSGCFHALAVINVAMNMGCSKLYVLIFMCWVASDLSSDPIYLLIQALFKFDDIQ